MGCICHKLRGRRDEEQGPLLQPTTPAAVQPTTLAAAPPTTLAAAPSLVSWCWICQYHFYTHHFRVHLKQHYTVTRPSVKKL